MHHPIKAPKKLIEVALPLEAINAAAIDEKSNPFLRGHPRGLHQWWARRPQTVARAVLFAQLVNDPSWKWELEQPGAIPPNNLKATWAAARNRLFSILENLVKWENSNNEEVLDKARNEIRKSWRETCEINKDHPRARELFNSDVLPVFHDPFAGGGAIPLEAQRLDLEAYASDLNPVAVVLNKALIEFPAMFTACTPVNPEVSAHQTLIARPWERAQGLAEDVRYYSKWMRIKAEQRIGELYPSIAITREMSDERPDLKPLIGQNLPVIAWIWARTVKSSNPAFAHVDVPIVSTFSLSAKAGKESYIEPIISGTQYTFEVRTGKQPEDARFKSGTKLSRGANFRCLLSDAPISPEHIKAEGKAGRIGARLMAVVAEGRRGKIFLSPSALQEEAAARARAEWQPDGVLVDDARAFTPTLYGFTSWSDLFTTRQLLALTTLVDLVQDVREQVKADAAMCETTLDTRSPIASDSGIDAYSDAIATLLACTIDKFADYNNTICMWNPTNQNVGHLFTMQAIPISWGFCEASPFIGGLSFDSIADGVARTIEALPAKRIGHAFQQDCTTLREMNGPPIISTDPPYYDNVPFADLSDFFYVWLRRSLKPVWPDLFTTIGVPKTEELVATPYRHGGKEAAETFFLEGMTRAIGRMAEVAHPAFPITIYYAFKQSDSAATEGTVSVGWETFLDAIIRSGLAIDGTWPMRTEREARSRGIGANALASSIILVCRRRLPGAVTTSRRAFQRELNQLLPEALDEMTKGSGDNHSPVAPVDLSQAIIGPGMAVFSKYAAVLEADGTPMSVKTALQLINRFLAEDDFDHDTQFCLRWFEGNGWKEGKFGEADTLARAKGTSVDGVKQSGVLYATAGVVRLLKWAEYPTNWNPQSDTRLPIWEVLHQLIRVFKTDGESGAAAMLAAVQNKVEATRQLAYRLYTLCERAGWSEDARAYNEIVTSWSGIESAAATAPAPAPQQTTLFS